MFETNDEIMRRIVKVFTSSRNLEEVGITLAEVEQRIADEELGKDLFVKSKTNTRRERSRALARKRVFLYYRDALLKRQKYLIEVRNKTHVKKVSVKEQKAQVAQLLADGLLSQIMRQQQTKNGRSAIEMLKDAEMQFQMAKVHNKENDELAREVQKVLEADPSLRNNLQAAMKQAQKNLNRPVYKLAQEVEKNIAENQEEFIPLELPAEDSIDNFDPMSLIGENHDESKEDK